MKTFNRIAFSLLTAFFIVPTTHAATITFNEMILPTPFPIGIGLPYQQFGFQITDHTEALYAFVSPDGISEFGAPPFVYGPPSDSIFLGFCTCAPGGVSISRMDTQLFALNNLDLGFDQFSMGARYATLTAIRADYSTFNYEVQFSDSNWHTISLSNNLNFNNLRSVSITGFGGYSFAVDNINVSSVPIPATAWLFGSAVLGLASAVRKRN